MPLLFAISPIITLFPLRSLFLGELAFKKNDAGWGADLVGCDG
jgi:hypothetical protein